jgi:hypothetical protein
VVLCCGGRRPQVTAGFAVSALACAVVSGMASLLAWGMILTFAEPPAATADLILLAPLLASLSGLLCLVSGARGERRTTALVSLVVQLGVLGGPLAVALYPLLSKGSA